MDAVAQRAYGAMMRTDNIGAVEGHIKMFGHRDIKFAEKGFERMCALLEVDPNDPASCQAAVERFTPLIQGGDELPGLRALTTEQ